MVAFGFASSACGLRAVRVVLLLLGVIALFAGDASAQAPGEEPPPRTDGSPSASEDTTEPAPDADPEVADEPSDPLEPSGPIAPPPEGVEEITVIGEVLETSTQAEAAAITTFDQAELDTLGIADVDSLALNTPSLHVGQVGQQAVITLRGVGLENLTSIGEAGVGFQVDGVHLGRPAAANAGFFDLERVDVFRGPQGTRGGRNLNGGKIALWSAKPTDELDVKGDVTYGNYDTIENRAVLNVPIWSDKLMTRVSTLFGRRRGYQDNDFFHVDNKDTADAKDFAGRGQLRSMLFDDQVELRAIGTHGFQKGRGPDFKIINAPPSTLQGSIATLRNNFNAQIGPGSFDARYVPADCPLQQDPFTPFEVCTPSDPRDVYNEFAADRDNEASGIIGTGTWDLPIFADTPISDLRLGLIGSWQQTIEDLVYDLDGTNIPEQVLDQRRNAKQNSFEAYIERPDVGRWDFRAGFYFLDEEIDSDVCLDLDGVIPFNDFGYDGTITTKSIAGYGEAGARLLDNLRVYGGARWSKDEKGVEEQFFDVIGLPQITNPLNQPGACSSYTRSLVNRGQRIQPTVIQGQSGPRSRTEDYQGVTPTGGLEWDVTESSTLGVSVTKGFKAGGFPIVVNPELIGLDDPYDSEITWEYELTSKNEFLDGRLRLNGTLFWVEYDPFQVCQFNGPAFFCNSNGSATIRGVEVEYVVTPLEGLQINGHFNWLDARINNFQIIDPTVRVCLQPECPTRDNPPQAGFPIPEDVSGNQLTRSPAWAGSFGIQYEFDFGGWGYVTPRFQTQFQGKTYYRVFNTDFDSQEPFAKFDAKFTWRSEDDRFTAEVFGVNLSDEDILNSVFTGSQLTGGQALGQYQPPRTYGVKLGVNYTSDWLADLL